MAKKKRAGRTKARKPKGKEAAENEGVIELGYFTVEQAAELLDVLPRRVRWWCEHYEGYAKKVGGEWLIPSRNLYEDDGSPKNDGAPKKDEQLYTVDQAAERLGCSSRRVRMFCEEGRLGNKLGRRWIITAADLKEFEAQPRLPGNPVLRSDNPPSRLG